MWSLALNRWWTSLSAEECRSRLQQRALSSASWSSWRRDPDAMVCMTRRDRSFRILEVQSKGLGAWYFVGSLQESGGRTIIKGFFRPHWVVVVFWTFSFGFLLIAGGSLSVAALQAVITGRYQAFTRVENHGYVPADGFRDILPLVLLLFGLMAFALAILLIGWRRSRDQRGRVVAFIVATCHGITV
jgi:hypothetical protein